MGMRGRDSYWSHSFQRQEKNYHQGHVTKWINNRRSTTLLAHLSLLGMLLQSLLGPFCWKQQRWNNSIYRDAPYGVYTPYIQNAMPCNAFCFMMQFIHFADNKYRKKKGEKGHDVMFKLSHFLKKIMKGLWKAWTAGEKITIDESMIRYSGRAICFVQ